MPDDTQKGRQIKAGKLPFSIESRLLRELGERLVRQPEVALLELVKNAYDADAVRCEIRIDGNDAIEVADDGVGMTLDDFTSGWMRIGTSSKGKRSESPKFGRPITGEKGIGRFAARFLGERLDLVSTAFDRERKANTRLEASFAWADFDQQADLESILVPYQLYEEKVFEIDQEDDRSMKVVVRPVAFLLKETARAPRAEMFVVVSGKVNFAITGDMTPPLAHYFAATVGYFRKRGQVVDHVLGVHYDHDDRRPVHPVYHAQLKSCAGFLSTINEHYRPTFALGHDLMTKVSHATLLTMTIIQVR